jgi:DNA uptake protein ComE-like DNA-binding protein
VIIAVAPRLYWNYVYDPEISIETSKIDPDKSSAKADKESVEKYTVPKDMFDPNSYSLEQWMTIGLSEKQSQTILNYLKKGGEIRYKEDLKKLFVIDQELFVLLAPKVDLPNKPKQKERESEVEPVIHSDKEVKSDAPKDPVNVNIASKEELMTISGIGSFYADEIIKRREKLGGIYSLDQLGDMYKMTPGKLDSLSVYLFIDPANINKINVNVSSKKDLISHPLISADVANSIVFIRERYGNYDLLDDLLQSPYIDAKKLEELKPYLSVE